MDAELNGYDLSRGWFDFCFDNPELIKATHTALYFFIIEHCNRMGWKEKFGLPMEMAKDAIGVKNYKTYSKAFNDLVKWGFILVIEKSVNQYSSNIIALVKNTKANTKALSKAMQKHSQKHSQKQVHGIVCIDKPITLEPITLELGQAENNFDFEEILNPDSFPTWRAECSSFLKDEYFKKTFCKDQNIPMGNTEELMREFVKKLNLENDFKNVAGIKVHFVRHYKKHLNGKTYSAFTHSKGFIDVPDNLDYDNMQTW